MTAAGRPSCRSHFPTLTCSNTPAAFLTVVVKGASEGSFPRSCSGWCISPSVHDSASCSTRNSEGLLAISLNEPGSCVVVGTRAAFGHDEGDGVLQACNDARLLVGKRGRGTGES